jgi:hypothetical protein
VAIVERPEVHLGWQSERCLNGAGSDSAQGTMNMNPKTTRTILAILAAAVAAIVAFNVLTREYGDPARNLIERKSATKP